MKPSLRNTLTKTERLHGNKVIDNLFSKGDAFISYPLRVVFVKREIEDVPNLRMMVSVSKKKFKRANKRNRIKRLVRESYRLNKAEFSSLNEECNIGLDVAFLYLKNELSEFKEIENAMRKTIVLLKNRIGKNEEENI